jgi:hypothetical protein
MRCWIGFAMLWRLTHGAAGGRPGGAGPGAAQRTVLERAALPTARHRPATPRAGRAASPGWLWAPPRSGRLPGAIPSLPGPSTAPSSAHDPGVPNRAQALSAARSAHHRR